MSVTDFRLSVGFFTHPKIREIERRRGARGVLGLIRLYAFTALHYTDGVLPCMDEDDLARHVGRGSHFKKLIEDLIEVRLLDRIEGGFAVHDWADHQPWAFKAKERSRNAAVNADARWRKLTKESKKSARGVSQDSSLSSTPAEVFRHSSGDNSAKNKEPADAPSLTNLTFPFPSSQSKQKPWIEILERVRLRVPFNCPPEIRGGLLQDLVTELHLAGVALDDDALATAVVDVFVPVVNENTAAVRQFVLADWHRAVRGTPTHPLSDPNEVAADVLVAGARKRIRDSAASAEVSS